VPEGYKMIAPDLLMIMGGIGAVVLVVWALVMLARRWAHAR